MIKSDEDKPLPALTTITSPFWKKARDGALYMQRCRKCMAVNFVPRAICVQCGSGELEWTEQSREGVIYSYTISEIVTMNLPGWEDELPILSCLIDIDNGARMYGQVIDCEPGDVRIGARVRAEFIPLNEEIGIPKFRLID